MYFNKYIYYCVSAYELYTSELMLKFETDLIGIFSSSLLIVYKATIKNIAGKYKRIIITLIAK